jgi:hypothetical protein
MRRFPPEEGEGSEWPNFDDLLRFDEMCQTKEGWVRWLCLAQEAMDTIEKMVNALTNRQKREWQNTSDERREERESAIYSTNVKSR